VSAQCDRLAGAPRPARRAWPQRPDRLSASAQCERSVRAQIPGSVDLLEPGLGREPLVGFVHLARVGHVLQARRTVGERSTPAAYRHPPVRLGSMVCIELRTDV
jgi:hypothetical protein